MTSERHRMLASLSFVTVLILIGIPLWWKTTEVYRVALPYDEIEELSKAPARLAVRVTVLANDEPTASELAGLLRQTLTTDVVLPKIDEGVLPGDLHAAISYASDEVTAAGLVRARFGLETPGHFYVVQRSRSSSAVWLGNERVVLFKDATAAVTVAAVMREWVVRSDALQEALSERGGAAARLPPGDEYELVLTVAHPAPQHYKLEFPAERALEDYIGSFVDELSALHNFTLRSQWLHLLEVDFKVEKHDGSRPHYLVRRERLPHVLSPLESRSGARASPHTPVRLLLYAVPCHIAPLHIADEKGEILTGPISGFMSARWGGVVLASPDEASCLHDVQQRRPYAPDVPLVMGTFLAQLRELVGIDRLPHIEQANLEPLRSVSPRRWELDWLMHTRSLQQLTSAVLTLTSIAQLLDKIPNIVINEEVGAAIRSATECVRLARAAAAAGNTSDAYAHSQRAMLQAEYAFTSPSLLALLYFPDDQKYAVYIPLFLPVMIPVLISLKNIFAWLRGKHGKEKTD